MRVCAVCNQILSAGEGCSRTGCPNLSSVATAGSNNEIQPGFTGRADRLIQRGQDRLAHFLRNLVRQALLGIMFLGTVLLLTGICLWWMYGSSEFSVGPGFESKSEPSNSSSEAEQISQSPINGCWGIYGGGTDRFSQAVPTSVIFFDNKVSILNNESYPDFRGASVHNVEVWEDGRIIFQANGPGPASYSFVCDPVNKTFSYEDSGNYGVRALRWLAPAD